MVLICSHHHLSAKFGTQLSSIILKEIFNKNSIKVVNSSFDSLTLSLFNCVKSLSFNQFVEERVVALGYQYRAHGSILG